MARKTSPPAVDGSPPACALPDGIRLAPDSAKAWDRLTQALPLNEGPRLLFVLADPPSLRRRLAAHLTSAVEARGSRVAQVRFGEPDSQPLQAIFAGCAAQAESRFCFVVGLERCLASPEHRLNALTDLNFHRDQISRRVSCPIVFWLPDSAFTDLARHAPDFAAWRGGVFSLMDEACAREASYRQSILDRYSKLTLYSATSDAPLAVDLERVFVKLTATSLSAAGEPRDMPGAGRPDQLGRPLPMPEAPNPLGVTMAEALRTHPRLVVIGSAGGGKTTLLRYLALTFARYQAEERLGLAEEKLPVLVPLRELNRILTAERTASPAVLPRWLLEQTRSLSPHVEVPEGFFAEALAEGRCVVLLDGLDEVAQAEQRERAVDAIATFANAFPGNRFVVTSRPRGYEGDTGRRLLPLFTPMLLRDFDDHDMRSFAQGWYEAVTRERLGDNPDAAAQALRSAEDLLRALGAESRVGGLARNPLLLSVLAMVHQRGVGLPQRRAELYDECTDMLLGYWDQVKGEAGRELAMHGGLTRAEKRTILAPIALWFHQRGERSLAADRDELLAEIAKQFVAVLGADAATARSRAEVFLRVIDERSGLLVETETGRYTFAHLTFQEYLAARAIADQEDYVPQTVARLHDPWWREVLLLEVGHLSDVRHFGRRARRLTTELLEAIRSAGSWLEEVLRRDLLFAARCLCDTSPLAVDDGLRTVIMDALVRLWLTTPYEPQREEIHGTLAYAGPTPDGIRIRDMLLASPPAEDEATRVQLARGLGALGAPVATPGVINRLLDLLSDPSASVRRTAITALGGLGEAAATRPVAMRLVDLIVSGDEVGSSVPSVLKRLVRAPDLPALEGKLRRAVYSGPDDVVPSAAQALRGIGSDATINAVIVELLERTHAREANPRCRAVVALFQIAWGHWGGRVAGRLVEMMRDNDPQVREEAAFSAFGMASYGPLEGISAASVQEQLLGLLADPDQRVTLSATVALGFGAVPGRLPVDDLVPRLVALTQSRESVRRAAAQALAWLAYSVQRADVAKALIGLMMAEDDGIVTVAANGLARLREVAAAAIMPRLPYLARHPEPQVRSALAKALGNMRDAGVIGEASHALLDLTRDDDALVRARAAEALGELGSVARRPVQRLLSLLADPDVDVRACAAYALGRLHPDRGVFRRLTAFWKGQLGHTRQTRIGSNYSPVCDIAYTELTRMAALHGAVPPSSVTTDS